jgi:hypothetical protein
MKTCKINSWHAKSSIVSEEKGNIIWYFHVFCLLIVQREDTIQSSTFMGPCNANIFQNISNKMQLYTVYIHLETALHVSGVTSTHHQERKQLYLQHLVVVTPLLLPTAIVEVLEMIWLCCGWRTPGSSNSVTNTRCCRYSCMRSWWWGEVRPETCRAVSRYK